VERRRAPRWLALLFLLVVSGLGALSIHEGYDQFRLDHYGVAADAEVVRLQKAVEPELTLRFHTSDGQVVEARTKRFTGPYDVGDDVHVTYDRSHPSRIQADDWGKDYTTAVVYAGLAVAAVITALLCVIGYAPKWLWG